MNKTVKKQIRDAMIPLLANRKSGHLACEAARILCAIDNVYVSSGLTPHVSKPSGVEADLVLARQQVVKVINHKREVKRKQNRKAYIKNKLKNISLEEKVKELRQELVQLDGPAQVQAQAPQGNPWEFLDSNDPDLYDYRKYPISQAEERDYKDNAKSGQDIEEYIKEKRKFDAVVHKTMKFLEEEPTNA